MLKSKQINYNGELDGFHVHKTVEIRAPYGNYVSVTVEDFNIGNKTIEMGGKEDDDLCGYGSIFIFAGQGSINQMIKVVEFCGSKDSPIIDYQNKNYLGIQGKNFFKFLRFRWSLVLKFKIIQNCSNFISQNFVSLFTFENSNSSQGGSTPATYSTFQHGFI